MVSLGLFYWTWHLQVDEVLTKGGKPISPGSRASGTAICIILGVLAFLIFFIRYILQTVRGTVESQSGIAETSFRISHGKSINVNYFATMNGSTFPISWKAYEMMIPGLNYRAYFISKSKNMVSIEPI